MSGKTRSPGAGGTGALLAFVDNGRLRVSSDAGMDPRLTQAIDGMSLNELDPLPHAIRSGEPQFVPDREEFIRRWPQARQFLRLTADVHDLKAARIWGILRLPSVPDTMAGY